ncbi:MAG: carboxylating nicotinate-nucleotide diphosphorylase [Candidatus Tectomicrobia bacterium]|uniref:Probable nicotinate-nucleotide pyrophosphorylase [carboxylating] n=1 Tax=Tectimicrobiota bacterium TaxID=2528274 RepID=A0A932CR71_UNCTE|nr:carboxylating nicotinate-nucleotide diphosphorylase [Candidatus Tectomicrobia bacterium]
MEELLTPQTWELIRMALMEDLGSGDITTENTVSPEARARGVIRAKASLVLAGLELARAVFFTLDPGVVFRGLTQDGEALEAGAGIAEVEGSARVLLKGERLALNFLQRLSGIATLTAQSVRCVQGTRARILDTRKTTPGWRHLEKYAVRMGGGVNHRYSLGHGILIKDNHIALAGGLSRAVEKAKRGCPPLMKIEVEVQSLDQVEEALRAGADMIMLDNMSCEEMARAVRVIGGRAWVEASGGIGLEGLAAVAQTGVDFISLGRLTHSAPAVDIALKYERI